MGDNIFLAVLGGIFCMLCFVMKLLFAAMKLLFAASCVIVSCIIEGVNPTCANGSLDMRYRRNQGFNKYDFTPRRNKDGSRDMRCRENW